MGQITMPVSSKGTNIPATCNLKTASTGGSNAAIRLTETVEFSPQAFSRNELIYYNHASNVFTSLGILNYTSPNWTFALLCDATLNGARYSAGHVFTWDYTTEIDYTFTT